MSRGPLLFALVLSLGWTTGCKERKDSPQSEDTEEERRGLLVVSAPGVDFSSKVVRIGALNDESGPAKDIGVPFAIGKRLLVREVNRGGYLPEGWKLELVERDYGYDVERCLAAYEEVDDEVLFVSTLFGTDSAIALRPELEADNMVAFPASLASELGTFELTPPSAASYSAEAGRGLDWLRAEMASEAQKIAIVYNADGYGRDALEGFRASAQGHGLEIVAELSLAPGSGEITDVTTGLQQSDASAVYLATLPSSTVSLLRDSNKRGYRPVFLGSTPSWTDRFFIDASMSDAFARFYWLSSLPFWGEDIPGMNRFLAAWEVHGIHFAEADFYTLTSYLGGLIQVEVLSRALSNNRVDRAAFLNALRSIDGWTADGLLQEVSYSTFPYPSMRRVRVLRPDFDRRSWRVVGDFAQPTFDASP